MPPEARARAWFDALYSAFEQALGRCPEHSLQLGLADHGLRLRCAGPAVFETLSAALTQRDSLSSERCPTVASGPLEVCAFDSASSGVIAPPFPQDPSLHLVRQELRGLSSDSLPIALLQDPSGYSLLQMFDRRRGQALIWTQDAARLPYWVWAAPLLAVLAWWLERPGQQVVHAGAVGDGRGAVLLVGAGGSGKSTTTLSCALAGLDYLADDFCLVRTSPPSVHSLYTTGKLFPTDLAHFPTLAARRLQTEPGAEKALFRLHVGRPDLPLRAIVLPQVRGSGASELRPASAAEALRRLAPSSLFHLPAAGAAAFASLAELTRSVPCYTLRLGSQRHDAPSLLRGLLEAHDAR